MIATLLKGIDACSKLGAYLSAFSMIVIVTLIFVEIICRSLFGISTMVSDEFSGYLMVTTVMAGLGYTLETDSHIRITILLVKLGPRLRSFMDILATCFATVLTLFIFYHAALMVYDSYSYDMRADSISETLIYLPQLVVPLGLAGLILQLFGLLLRRCRACSPTP
jgi:TRAP-type C4-dicarboxylate transport system permease small subunit